MHISYFEIFCVGVNLNSKYGKGVRDDSFDGFGLVIGWTVGWVKMEMDQNLSIAVGNGMGRGSSCVEITVRVQTSHSSPEK